MSNFTVVYDACVFYLAPVRDLLMQLATTQLFRARWTEHIHDEWTRSVLAERTDLSPTVLLRTRDLMNTAVPDCVVAGYDGLIDSLHYPILMIGMSWPPLFGQERKPSSLST